MRTYLKSHQPGRACQPLQPDSWHIMCWDAVVRKTKHIFCLAVVALITLFPGIASGQKAGSRLVNVVPCDSLTVYYPHFTRIDLVTGTMPSKSDGKVIFCCAGSFTGERLTSFKHSNIAGDHVSGGTFHKGYKCGPYNGVFTWSERSGWHFYNYSYKNAPAPLQRAAEEGGMGFCQTLLFGSGKRFKGCFKPETVNRYRALCQIGKRLCIVDCARPLPFGHFLDGLEKLGVTHALYCDMGRGWNYSWYRKEDGSVKELFPTPGKYTTNWITFYLE